MAIDSGKHRAWYAKGEDGTWVGGCLLCGTSFEGAARLAAESWVGGHDSAVVCARRVAERAGPQFPLVGPGNATRVDELSELLEKMVDPAAEIVHPMNQVPVLYLWTAATEEGWHREPLGAVYLDHGASFVPAAVPDAVSPDAVDPDSAV